MSKTIAFKATARAGGKSAALQSPTRRARDLSDLRRLEQAIKKNGDRPLIPWDHARKTLDLD